MTTTNGHDGAGDPRPWLAHYPEWTPAHLDYGDDTLLDVYRRAVAEWPDRPAVTFFNRTRTYAELDLLVRRAAARLRDMGVAQGDRVAILLPNCPQHLVAYWALLHLGATVIEHNPLYTAHELRGPFADHGAKLAIVWDNSAEVVETLVADTPLETVVPVDITKDMPLHLQLAMRLPVPKVREMRSRLTAGDGRADGSLFGGRVDRHAPPLPTTAAPVTRDDVAVIMYTSGTTGSPKGAQLTHGNLVANILQGRSWVPGLGDEREVSLGVLPMFHAYGLTIVTNVSMLIGAELVQLPAAEMPLIMKVLKRKRPTWVPGVPTLYEKIMETAEKEGASIEGIRFSFCGASTLPVSVVRRWEEMTGGKLVEGYGLTETSPIIVGNPMDGNRRPGYVGIPFPDTEVRVVDPEEPTRELPYGEEGEVVVRGPQVFAGYLNMPEATEKSFADGWYRTGDVGVMEPDGFLRLVARIKEVIITGGFNVYPAEVEEVLLEHPHIADATVVGLPKSDGSELVVAAVALDDYAQLDTGAYRDHCRDNLTRYKVPRAFFHLDEMPRDMMGKVRRRDVRDVLLERLAEDGRTVDDLTRR
ncbi:long-chain-fatty-acid--CoA ligase [Corynebacterium sp. 335C]